MSRKDKLLKECLVWIDSLTGLHPDVKAEQEELLTKISQELWPVTFVQGVVVVRNDGSKRK